MLDVTSILTHTGARHMWARTCISRKVYQVLSPCKRHCHWANRAGDPHNLGPWGKLATSAWKDDLPIPLMFMTFRKDASVRTKRRYAVVSQKCRGGTRRLLLSEGSGVQEKV